ncbi:hypothetical protein PGTUg99_018187 [Puccinia graminis f. sp. tritici]|uniref:Uncharacterized protein n=1 Tax=Puccinia graminis f. sp. tritici TaxID=56615 RepID=A0A5B0SK53_PUCGR|nr:hypothetical protein PGTUg99_018187 [Puccinia graminis f. sp. tritici]
MNTNPDHRIPRVWGSASRSTVTTLELLPVRRFAFAPPSLADSRVQLTQKMDEENTIDSVARMVSSFRSSNADGKTEEEYLEIIRNLIGHLHERVGLTKSLKIFDILPLESETLCRIEQIILPSLKGKLRSLSLAFNSTNSQNDANSWYDVILNELIEIDNYLEQLETSMGPVRRDDVSKREIFPFRVIVISGQVFDLFSRGLCRLFAACQTFFDQLNFSNLSSSRINQGRDIARLTTVSVEKIDDLIPTLQKPLLRVAKEEWKAFVDGMNYQFKQPVQRPGLNLIDPDDWIWALGNEVRDKSFKAATPVSKLCRIFFNHLSRSTVNQPLIFDSPSMEMKEDQLNQFFHFTRKTDYTIHDFLEKSLSDPTDRQALQILTFRLEGRVVKLSQILEGYWDGLLRKKDPQVDQEAIADAREWLECWSCLFSIATENFMQVTGCKEVRW